MSSMSLRVKVTPKARYAFPCRHPDLVVRLVRSSRAQSLSDSAGAFLYSLGLIRMASPQAICVSPHLVPKANSKFAESVCHRAFRVSQYTSQKLSGYASEIVPGKLHGYVCQRSVRFRMMRRRNCQKICWKICRGNGQEILSGHSKNRQDKCHKITQKTYMPETRRKICQKICRNRCCIQ